MANTEKSNVQNILQDMARGNETGKRLGFDPTTNTVREFNPKDPTGDHLVISNEMADFSAA